LFLNRILSYNKKNKWSKNLLLLKSVLKGVFLLSLLSLLSSCMVVDTVGGVAKGVGKTVVFTGKTVGATVRGAGKAISVTTNATKKTVNWLSGSKRIKLERSGNSYYVNAVINRRHKIKLLLDTGATDTQLPMAFAKQIGVPKWKTRPVNVRVASGGLIPSIAFTIPELSVEGAKARDVGGVVLKNSNTGLLGMSYLNNFIFKIDPQENLLYLKRR
jgi:clan AA aspartic protease (TIGR02281 family)